MQQLSKVQNQQIIEETKIAPSLGPIHYIPQTKQSQKLSHIIHANTIQSLKIASIGNVDSGKSTLIGVLTKGIADDGRGSARKRVFNFQHEEQSGRTSSIGHEIMGFDENEMQVIPERFVQSKNKYWQEVMQNSQKMITFLDLCGHEKYLKTTIYGLVGMFPDFAMIIIGANMGISRMTKEHLGIALALKIPFFIVITKIDIAPENVYQETMAKLVEILKSQNVKRLPFLVKENTELKEIETVSLSMQSNRICPIFSVSAVNLKGMASLKYFLTKLPINTTKMQNTIAEDKQVQSEQLEFCINETFLVPGIGLIVSGVVKNGEAKLNQIVQFGPDKLKQFKQVVIKSIHVNRTSVEKATQGQCACFQLKSVKNTEKLTREEFRKGMVIVDTKTAPSCYFEFTAEILVLHHSTTINPGYQSVVHCGVIRQAAQVQQIKNKEFLRTNDKDIVKFKFLYAPEIVKKGDIILLREGRTKVLGTIVEVGGEEKQEEKIVKKKIEPAFG